MISLLALILILFGCGPATDEGGQAGAGKTESQSVKEDMSFAAGAWSRVPARLLALKGPCVRTGVPGNGVQGLFSAEGAFQVGMGRHTLYLWLHDEDSDGLIFPEPGQRNLSLAEGYLPIPKVRWQAGAGLEVEAEAMALHQGVTLPQALEDTFFSLRIRIFNTGDRMRRVKAMVGLSPRDLDGSFASGLLTLAGDTVQLEGKGLLRLPRAPDFFGTCPMADQSLAENTLWQKGTVGKGDDSTPMAGVCAFALQVEAAQGAFAHAEPMAELGLLVAAVPGSTFPSADQVLDRAMETRLYWTGPAGLNRISFQLPHRACYDTFRNALATLLLQWQGESQAEPNGQGLEAAEELLDLALASVALDRTGHFDLARIFLGRLAGRLENRSPAQDVGSMYRVRGLANVALADHYRFTRDKAWLEENLPVAVKLAEQLILVIEKQKEAEAAKASEEAEDGSNGEKAFFPLERAWAIHGLEGAAYLASSSGARELGQRFTQEAGTLRAALNDYLVKTNEKNELPFVAGEPLTSLEPDKILDLIALLWPGQIMDPNSNLTKKIFRHYYEEAFLSDPGKLTNRPLCLVQMCWAMIILYQPEQVLECVEAYLDLQEVPGLFTGKDKGPCFRRAAAFVIAFRMLFIHEGHDSLTLGPCLPSPWYDYQDALGVKDAITPYGAVSFEARIIGKAWHLSLDTSAAPARGFIVRPCRVFVDSRIEVDGKTIRGRSDFARTGEIPLSGGFLSVKIE